MNDNRQEQDKKLLEYQTLQLKRLINEMVQCCADRRLWESQKFNIPYSELKCLMLFDGERYLTVKLIAQKLDVAKSRVTKLLKGLLEKGLVKEVSDPGDGRVKLISLTPEGEKQSREILSFENSLHLQILQRLGNGNRESILTDLELLRTAMEAVKAQLI